MPITYNKDTNSWKLYDATPEETDALIQVAADHLVEAFGSEAAYKIMNDAAAFHKMNPENSQAGVEISNPPTLN